MPLRGFAKRWISFEKGLFTFTPRLLACQHRLTHGYRVESFSRPKLRTLKSLATQIRVELQLQLSHAGYWTLNSCVSTSSTMVSTKYPSELPSRAHFLSTPEVSTRTISRYAFGNICNLRMVNMFDFATRLDGEQPVNLCRDVRFINMGRQAPESHLS